MSRMHRLAIAVTLPLLALIGACGDTTEDPSATTEEAVGEGQELLYACDGTNEVYTQFYSNYAKTDVIGWELCRCNGTYDGEGSRSGYRTSVLYACY